MMVTSFADLSLQYASTLHLVEKSRLSAGEKFGPYMAVSFSTSDSTLGRPGYWRCWEPSKFSTLSFRYQARIVSGLATQATSRSAFRRRRFPISVSVIR